MYDRIEEYLGTNSGKGDSDEDEIRLGTYPTDSDTDKDGLPDGIELEYGMIPTNPDTFSYGILDGNRIFNVTMKSNDALLVLTEQLFPHLYEVQELAEKRVKTIMAGLLKKNPVPEKETDAMAWTRHMNMLKTVAEEAVVREIIYSI